LNSTSTSTEIGNIAFAVSFIVVAAVLGYRYIRSTARNNCWRLGPHRSPRLVGFLFEETDIARNHFALVPLDCGGT
jgi:hypothetical protein